MSLGVYPQISLLEARGRRDQERKKLAHQIDPAANRKAAKAAWADDQANTFEMVAREWIASRASIWTPSNTDKTTRRLEMDEVLHVRPDYIEHQLAHAVRDPNGRAYILGKKGDMAVSQLLYPDDPPNRFSQADDDDGGLMDTYEKFVRDEQV